MAICFFLLLMKLAYERHHRHDPMFRHVTQNTADRISFILHFKTQNFRRQLLLLHYAENVNCSIFYWTELRKC